MAAPPVTPTQRRAAEALEDLSYRTRYARTPSPRPPEIAKAVAEAGRVLGSDARIEARMRGIARARRDNERDLEQAARAEMARGEDRPGW